MKERYIKRPIPNFENVEFLESMGFQTEYAEALAARGLNKDNFDSFFGDELTFHSPFEMANMQEAVETISYVIETGGSVLIYGDYDADGLTASSLLSLFFTDNGVENNVLIPTRDEGYGLHAEKVIRAFKRNYYDLVITVDCGISNAEEVKQITDELGVEVIVTDHHELPEVLPACICVNPKLGYPFPYLAGAGVAWKLVEALAGRDTATKYAHLAAIGTIGDIMPMQDENRSIVKLGLANFNHKNLQKLAALTKCPTNISCNDIAMKIAPRINAAGRVGMPEVALSFLLCRDKVDAALCQRLVELNDLRKNILDEIIVEADSMCDGKTIYSEKMVFIYSDHWNHGLLGIVASRYKEKYHLPTMVMTLDGDDYVGSARGIDNIDLFEVFSSCKDYLVKFGGHKASVGFSLAKDNIQQFREAMAQTLSKLDSEQFEKHFYYDIDLNGKVKGQEILAISDKLQPYLPQDKIVCRIRDVVKFANAFGKDDVHLSVTLSNGLELKGFFNYGKYAPFIRNGANVDALCVLETDSYNHNICGMIEDITLFNSVCFDEFYKLNFLKNFVTEEIVFTDQAEIAKVLQRNSVLAIFDDYETYLKYAEIFDLSDYVVDIFFDNSVANRTAVVSPLEDYNYDKYENVVYFCKRAMHRKMPSTAVFVEIQWADGETYNLQLSREVCLLAYAALKKKNQFDSLKGVFDKYLLGKMSYAQYVVSLRVFQELSLIKITDDYTVNFEQTEKQDLSSSSIYRCFASGQVKD